MHVFFLVLQKDFIKNKTRQYKSYKAQQLNPDSRKNRALRSKKQNIDKTILTIRLKQK
jgi:hypothetical protein